jgi:hypothetical protein
VVGYKRYVSKLMLLASEASLDAHEGIIDMRAAAQV